MKYIKKSKCNYCLSTENLTKDHRIPIIQGGKDDIKNFQTLCFTCNQLKSGLSSKQVTIIWSWHDRVNKMRAKAGKRLLPKKPYLPKRSIKE